MCGNNCSTCKCGGKTHNHKHEKDGQVKVSEVINLEVPINVGVYETAELQQDAEEYADALYSNLMDENDILQQIVRYNYIKDNSEEAFDKWSQDEFNEEVYRIGKKSQKEQWGDATFIRELMKAKIAYQKSLVTE